MNIEETFKKTELFWRYIKAVAFVFGIHSSAILMLCNTYNLIIVEKVFNPLCLISRFFQELLGLSWLFQFIWPNVCLLFLIRVYVKTYSVKPYIPKCRWDYVKLILSPLMLIYCVTVSLVVSILLYNYSSLSDARFNLLVINCNEMLVCCLFLSVINIFYFNRQGDAQCINHRTLVLLLFGYFLGFRYILGQLIYNEGLLTFLPAYLSTFKSASSKVYLESYGKIYWNHGSVVGIFAAILFYSLCGKAISFWAGSIIGLSEEASMGYWQVIIDVPLLLMLFWISCLFSIMLYVIHIGFEVFLTQRLNIPVESSEGLENEFKHWKLSNGLSSNCELLQALSFLKLQDLSSHVLATEECRQLFSISQPGGHDRNWQGILKPTMCVISNFNDRLYKHNYPEEAFTFESQKSKDNSKEIFCFKYKLNEFFSWAKSLPVLCYFLAELPDAVNRQIIGEALPVIWAIKGLSGIVARSYVEDKYGIVQRNLVDIVSVLLQLQQVIDKVSRSGIARRGLPHDSLCIEGQLLKSVRVTLKSSLYLITTTFKDSIK